MWEIERTIRATRAFFKEIFGILSDFLTIEPVVIRARAEAGHVFIELLKEWMISLPAPKFAVWSV